MNVKQLLAQLESADPLSQVRILLDDSGNHSAVESVDTQAFLNQGRIRYAFDSLDDLNKPGKFQPCVVIGCVP